MFVLHYGNCWLTAAFCWFWINSNGQIKLEMKTTQEERQSLTRLLDENTAHSMFPTSN